MSLPPTVALALLELRRARARALVAAIALGGALVVASSVLGATMQRQVAAGAGVEYQHADLVVRSQQGDVGVDGSTTGGAGMTAEQVDRLAKLPGVDAAAGLVRVRAALSTDQNVRAALLETLPGSGFAWQGLVDGRYPAEGAEVALARHTLSELGLRVGDRVALGSAGAGQAVFTIVGSIDVRGSLRYQAVTYGIVTEPVARALARIDGFNEAQLRLAPGADPRSVTAEINASVPVGWPQTTGDIVGATEQLYGSGLSVLSGMLRGFALVAGLIALVVLTTVVWAAQPGRRRIQAQLRTIGATRGQIASMVTLETAALAVVGALLAVPLGIAVAVAVVPLLGYPPGVPEMSWSMLAFPIRSLVLVPVAAVIGGVAAALLPAVAAARVAPAVANRAVATSRAPRKRFVVPVVCALLILPVGLFWAALAGDTRSTAAVGLALAVVWIAATPLVCRAGASVAARLAGRRRHAVAELMATQLRRFPGRAGATGLGATLAAAILAVSWVALSSIAATTEARAARDPGPDVVVGAYAGGAPLAADTAARFAELPQVADVLPIDSAAATLVGPRAQSEVPGPEETRISGNIVASTAGALAKVTEDRFPVTTADSDVAYLPSSRLPPFPFGAQVRLIGPDGERPLRVVYVDGMPFQALVSPDVLKAVGAPTEPRALWIALRPGVDRRDALDAIGAVAVVAGDLPVSGVATGQVRVDQAIGLARGLATGMLAISVLIAVIGAVLTLATTMRERSTEFAVLRLLGLDSGRLRRLVSGETWVIGAISVGTGLLLGTVLGAAAAIAAAEALDLSPVMRIPVLPLIALGLLIVVVLRLGTTSPLDRVSSIAPAGALREASIRG